MNENKVKQSLKNGEVVAVAEVNRIFSPKIIDVLGYLGYKCAWIDMEHSDASYEQVYNMICAARASDIEIIVRMQRGTYSTAIKPLEAGAGGLVMPHCMSGQDAKDYVWNCKFAPLGLRGIGGGGDSMYGTMPTAEYVKCANDRTLLAVMIEDRQAIEAIDDIASVDGIDLLFIGPGDLSQSFGVVGDINHPLMIDAMVKVSAAAKKHGKAWGTVRGNDEYFERQCELGVQWTNVINDTSALFNGYGAAKAAFDEARGL